VDSGLNRKSQFVTKTIGILCAYIDKVLPGVGWNMEKAAQACGGR
jgi:hypothetical protein